MVINIDHDNEALLAKIDPADREVVKKNIELLKNRRQSRIEAALEGVPCSQHECPSWDKSMEQYCSHGNRGDSPTTCKFYRPISA